MNIQISDSQHWKKLNIGDMKFIIDFIVVDDYTDWRLPRYEDIVKMVPLVSKDGNEIYVNGIWTIQMFETFSEIPSYSSLQYWMIPVREWWE